MARSYPIGQEAGDYRARYEGDAVRGDQGADLDLRETELRLDVGYQREERRVENDVRGSDGVDE